MNKKNEYYRDENDNIKFNELCEDCENTCKQSFKTIIEFCPKLKKKNDKKKKK